MKICSYQTWKNNNPGLIMYESWDNTKTWIRDVVGPTMTGHGWKLCIHEYDYGLFSQEKPKKMAVRLIEEQFGEDWIFGKEFVYHPYRYPGNNGYQDSLFVWYKEIED
jgi:hypothetical protein